MTEIRREHVEWAVVDRLRLMLEAPRHGDFNVTETFALFSSVLCWVLQHVRIGKDARRTLGDSRAADLAEKLEQQSVHAATWCIPLLPRAVSDASVPEAHGFDDHHTALRFLTNLRDAVAHGDARNVEPFHSPGRGMDRNLLGFSFKCEEYKGRGKQRRLIWSGDITLLEADMRQIATTLATLYCDAVSCHSFDFANEARRHVQETAA
jgi:hypothetical protein